MKHALIGSLIGLVIAFIWLLIWSEIVEKKIDQRFIYMTCLTFAAAGSALFHWWKN